MYCLICHTPDDERPGGKTGEFDALFGHLVRENSDTWWAVESSNDPWNWPPAWYGEDHILDPVYAEIRGPIPNPQFTAVMSSRVFSKYIQYFASDWVDVLAFPKQPRLSRSDTLQIDGLPHRIDFPVDAQRYILNVDASFWAIITPNESEIGRIQAIWPNSRIAVVNTPADMG